MSEYKFEAEPLYFPLEKGVYEVGPGLRPLGFDLGAGEFDQRIFQIAADYNKFRENKLNCYRENLEKYRPAVLPESEFKAHLTEFFKSRLLKEYPPLFKAFENENAPGAFAHSGDSFSKLSEWKKGSISALGLPLDRMEELDFLSLQFPEDWAITDLTDDGKDHLSYLNVCSPSHWAPGDKLHQSFLQVHHVVPGSEKLVAASRALVEAMINKGPYVRFVWSFVTDKNLNHHPSPAPGVDPATWKGRSWNATQSPPFHLRVERQTTWGFPKFNKALFTIRVGFIDGKDILASAEKRRQLLSTLMSMTPASRTYKGVDVCFDDLTAILK
ncbi:MAG: heme-dependent oxidative N-demethylase subunit alpha family protein [Bdellovibrionota bacterium]